MWKDESINVASALTKLWRSGLTSVRLAQRARIILLADQGLNNKDIAAQLGIGRMQPARWRERYLQGGIKAIERDLPRGAPPEQFRRVAGVPGGGLTQV